MLPARGAGSGILLSPMKRHILTVNCGSSSLKYALFEADERSERVLARDEVQRIGETVPDHATAVRSALAELARMRLPEPDAIGHRVVHGGRDHVRPARVDDALLASLRALVPFAPLHLHAELLAIEEARARFPDRPQVVCFDTAFHRTMPEVAQRFALPRRLFDEGVRRYGFHGLSYEYIVESIGARSLGRAVIAHLGNGASLCAVREGRSIDTTMAFTPTGGIVMGTRSGDLDPGLIVYLLGRGLDAAGLDRLVNHEAGLLALSETTADMKRLVLARDRDARAALAIDVFCWQARKAVGALTATLGGLDSLVFTGGIGAHAPLVRREITRGLEHLGVRLDEGKNEMNADLIGSREGTVTVRVVATDEERMIVRHTARLV
jgi:acetate kinase